AAGSHAGVLLRGEGGPDQEMQQILRERLGHAELVGNGPDIQDDFLLALVVARRASGGSFDSRHFAADGLALCHQRNQLTVDLIQPLAQILQGQVAFAGAGLASTLALVGTLARTLVGTLTRTLVGTLARTLVGTLARARVRAPSRAALVSALG